MRRCYILIILLVCFYLSSCGKDDKKPEYTDEGTGNSLQQNNNSESEEKKIEENKPDTNKRETSGDKTSQSRQYNKESFRNEKPVAVISPVEAGDYNGKTVTVKGFVADIYKSEKVAYLNFVEKYPKNPFTAVIFARQFGDFPDVTKFRNKDVEVTGRISFYNGKPQIILNDPSQIKVN